MTYNVFGGTLNLTQLPTGRNYVSQLPVSRTALQGRGLASWTSALW